MRFADAGATYRRLYELSYRDPQWMEKVAARAILARAQGRAPPKPCRTLEEEARHRQPPAQGREFLQRGLRRWNVRGTMADQALTYAQRAMDLSESEHPGEFDAANFPTYARLMVRGPRKTEEAFNRLTHIPNLWAAGPWPARPRPRRALGFPNQPVNQPFPRRTAGSRRQILHARREAELRPIPSPRSVASCLSKTYPSWPVPRAYWISTQSGILS